MQQKSNTYFQEYKRSAVETIDRNIRKYCDWVCGVGIGILISTMIGLVYLLILS
jgi:hypothetical protein